MDALVGISAVQRAELISFRVPSTSLIQWFLFIYVCSIPAEIVKIRKNLLKDNNVKVQLISIAEDFFK